MNRQQNITIKIADVAPISMTINSDTEQTVREAEYNINRLWSAWRIDFDSKTSKEVLAMVAFQFAKKYYQLAHAVEERSEVIKAFETELDRLLQIAAPPSPAAQP